ncbi:hypothetical protein BDZ91DRAFT_690460 [Kalaharituber pfeilii]|nr:hypothetical protein BDZ91DRAFT_690460 [Kalaharituber pfeilii]
MASESKKRLALAIIDFLNSSANDGTFSSDEADSVDVAKQVIADLFKVDPEDKAAMTDALGGQSLLSIYGVFEKMKGRAAAAKSPPATPQSAATPPTSAPTSAPPAAPTAEQKAEAESLKGQGNAAMAKKDYPAAIDLYTRALALIPGNPIFLSNRAAAYSASHQHEKAAADAQAAVNADSTYSKAWSRLGLAKFALGDTRGAMQAYERGMEVEAAGGKTASEPMKRGYETAKRRLAEEEDAELDDQVGSSQDRGSGGGLPDLSNLANMFGGGGRGGGGGMPDLAGLLKNPMVAQMADNLMKNPDLIGKMMNNPKLKEMMDGVGGGGGLPDMSKLMSDPTIAEMAKNFMGGAGPSGGEH